MVVHCKVCGKQFDSFRGLNGHMNAHLKRLAAEPNVGTTIDDAIMDAYLDEGESYEDAEIYARRAMNKLKHSAENRIISQNVSHTNIEPLENYNEVIDDEDYWEPYILALHDYYAECVRYVDDATNSWSGMVDAIHMWQDVAANSAHNLKYVLSKTWKFKYDAIRDIWTGDAEEAHQYVIDQVEDWELLENFNPGHRLYEGSFVDNMYQGWPSLKEVRDVFGEDFFKRHSGEPYYGDLFSAEENKYKPLSGKRRTMGKKQKWIPDAIEYVRQHGKSTAAEIRAALPKRKFSGTPVNAMALSNRLIRMPDIFIVDKSRKPYTYSLVDTKEMNVEAYDEKIRIWKCGACDSWSYDQNVAEECCSSEAYEAEFEQLSDAVVAVTDRYDENVGYVVATDGDDEDIDFDNVGVAILDDDMEPIAEIEIGQAYYGYDQEDEDYYHSEQYYSAESGVSTVKVYVEREDNRPWRYVTFDMSNHTLANKDNLHNAIEDRLIDILQESFGGWDLISITPVEKDAETFEANFNPNQPRNSLGQWVSPDAQLNDNKLFGPSAPEPTMPFELDELEALAVAIRLQDETFPEVGMLLEQIGDTAENRQVIFDEMMVVMSNLVNKNITPEVETPADYYQYVLDEPVNDEVERIYRQANYYAQFKTNVEINSALDELMDQYTIAREMGAPDEVIKDIEQDINFVELVSRVQNMQREFQAPDWNPVQPRVPQSPCKGGKCAKPGECKSCNNPGKGTPGPSGGPPGKGGKGGANPMGPPMPPTDNQEKLFVNKLDGSLWTGKTQPNADWRPVTYIPITQNGQQKYIRNIMDDVVKMFPPSAVVYRRKPPLLVITDLKFNINMLANHGFKINNREITYA